MNKKPNIPTIDELLRLAENEATNEQKADWSGSAFAKDAAEGVRMMDNPVELVGISERLNQKIGGKVVPAAKVVRFQRTQFMAVAASVALIAICVFMFNTSFDSKEMAMEDNGTSEQVVPTIESEKGVNLKKDESPSGSVNNEVDKDSKADDKNVSGSITHSKSSLLAKKREEIVMNDEELEEKNLAEKPVYVIEEEEIAMDDFVVAKSAEASKSAPVLKKEMYKPVLDEEKILLGEDIVKQVKKYKESDKKDRVRVEEDDVAIEMEGYESRLLSEKQNKQYNKGISHFKQLEYDSAIQVFDSVLDDLPSSFEVNYQQAVTYLEKGRISKAKKKFELASELANSANSQLDFSKLNKLLSDKKIAEARSYVSQFQLIDSQLRKK
ncbi:MAG: tetratricopeptide (TPR) repeat protein [Flammeovirgaceae bacterium]|jgi:tetratricopeptide (TPR) repeat protein